MCLSINAKQRMLTMKEKQGREQNENKNKIKCEVRDKTENKWTNRLFPPH